MKSVVTEPRASDRQAPLLVKHKESELVVLVEKDGVTADQWAGVVVHPNNLYDIGESQPTFNKGSFTDFHGTVTLSNQ